MKVLDLITEELLAMHEAKSPSFHNLQSAARVIGDLLEADAEAVTVRQIEALLIRIESDSTKAKVRMLLVRAFARAVADGKLDRDPMPMVPKIPRKGGRDPRASEDEILEPHEIRRLMAAAHHGHLWALLLGSGMRIGEALAVTPEAIDICDGGYRLVVCGQKHHRWGDIRETKAGTLREVALGKWVIDAMWHKMPFTITESTAQKNWAVDLARAGLKHRRLHSTRHTFISLLHRLGTPEEVIRDQTHPKGSDAFATYLHRGFAPKVEAARKLEALIRGGN